jgi:hypothetical protein
MRTNAEGRAERLEGLLGEGLALRQALEELAGGGGPHHLARLAGVDPRSLAKCLDRVEPYLHVRRGLEEALGLPPYTLDPLLEDAP